MATSRCLRARATEPVASHWSDIGFDIRSVDDIVAHARAASGQLASGQLEMVAVNDGAYLRWSTGDGAEIWFQRDPGGNLVGANPHAAASTRTAVRIMSRTGDPKHSLDGGFDCWLAPWPWDPTDADADPGTGEVPVYLDAPDFRVYDGLSLPADRDAAIVAFAHELNVYANEGELRATGSMMAVESLIPSGLFHPGGEQKVPAKAEAIFHGTVLEAEVRRNGHSGNAYHWARVRTYGATLEVVADPALARPPRAGDIVGGSFWLSARFHEAVPAA